MAALSKVLRSAAGGRLHFHCPGCEHTHGIQTGDGAGPRWAWNGNVEAPTFSPSILVTGSDLTEKGERDYEDWMAAGCPSPAPKFESQSVRCHSFITDGQIQFLTDCTHHLAGKTVPMAEFPSNIFGS